MSGADYRHCDRCGAKAFYDADTAYGDAVLLTLCGPCSTIATLKIVEPPAAPAETIDLVAALRNSIEAAKQRRAERGQG